MDAITIINALMAADQALSRSILLAREARSTLSEQDQAKVDAALAAIGVQNDADFARIDAKLAEAEKITG